MIWIRNNESDVCLMPKLRYSTKLCYFNVTAALLNLDECILEQIPLFFCLQVTL